MKYVLVIGDGMAITCGGAGRENAAPIYAQTPAMDTLASSALQQRPDDS